MSVFPARILLATDGSPDAGRATETAVEVVRHAHCPVFVARGE